MSFSNDNPALESQLPISVDFPEEYTLYRTQFTTLYQRVANTINGKEGGLYVLEEKTAGIRYFDENDPQSFRNVYRMVVNFGSLPDSTSKSVFHNIADWSDTYRLTRSYGSATDRGNFSSIPIPNDGIFLEINDTSVTITTTNNLSMYTDTTVVIEYTKE